MSVPNYGDWGRYALGGSSLPNVYVVHTGRPSWHQQQAGHVSAGEIHFGTKAEAETCVATCKRLRPDEPAWIEERVKP